MVTFPHYGITDTNGEIIGVQPHFCVAIVPMTMDRSEQYFGKHLTVIVDQSIKESRQKWIVPPPWKTTSQMSMLGWGLHAIQSTGCGYLYQPWPGRKPRSQLRSAFTRAVAYWEGGGKSVLQDGSGVLADLQNKETWEWYRELADASEYEPDKWIDALPNVEFWR